MKIFKNPGSFQKYCLSVKKKGTVGFVPTMGCLHEGHLSLIRKSKKTCNKTVVSIFVNPIQFGPKEDFHRYPRPLKNDLSLCRREKADAVFIPENKGFYGDDFSIHIQETRLSSGFCGEFRPGHFSGVLTVVAKLLNCSQPDYVFMGQKDYQQCLVIRRLMQNLNFPVTLMMCPTVREKSGLAMSSRNQYLSPTEKKDAALIHQALRKTQHSYRQQTAKFRGKKWKQLRNDLRSMLRRINNFVPQYVEIVNAETLEKPDNKTEKTVALIAGFLGKTRLIDNIIL
ncbi:MAG: pantoate--beta-alanine ligase [Candidatus Aureabacteria bacterium]|nr:pantoate--beta-alanine ligase [Candidatus Auribacterota bacterium]